MRQRLRLFLYFAVFWIGFQIIIRAVFLLYNYDLSSQLTTGEILNVFWHGLRMDMSMSGYFLMATGLILTISVFTQSRWLYLILHAITVTGLLLSSIIMMVDLELYRHWGFRMDSTPVFYMQGTEQEALGSVDISVAIKLLFILTALFSAMLFLYSVFILPGFRKLQPAPAGKALLLLVVSALMFVPIRGSLKVAPMNSGFVYFHPTKSFANHAAINVVWNFLNSFRRISEMVYPTDVFDHGLGEDYFRSLYPQGDSTIKVFNNPRPNIILFILESFTADVIAPLGGLEGIAPNLSHLCSEGILFDNIYASGDRTDKGIVAILGAYPAQTLTSIIKFPAKTQHLNYLTHHISDLGYRTSFVYGGDIDFANMRSFLTNSRFDHITTDEDFPDEEESKWGVHDHVVFDRAFQECDTAEAPFFKVVLSLSSHEPFDVPMPPYIKGEDEESLFLNSVHYTDMSIGSFVDKAKKSAWWEKTVIVFIADHGHRHPGNKALADKKRFRIPLLMIGGAVEKDSVVHTFASQTDLANTILAQLDAADSNFRFSKNILSPDSRSFAAYFFNNGYGFVTPECDIMYDNNSKQFLRRSGASEADLDLSRAYQQVVYLDYNSK